MRQPTSSPVSAIAAVVTPANARSANVRPASTAERDIGSERNRSNTPRDRSSAIAMHVVAQVKATVCTKMPPIRNSV